MCFGFIAFWYLIAVPSFNKSEMEEFSGTYKIQTIGKENTNTELKLFEDGPYSFNGNRNSVGLAKSGTWKTGGIDGQFEFYNENGNLYRVCFTIWRKWRMTKSWSIFTTRMKLGLYQ